MNYNHSMIYVRDIERSREFYLKLGLKLIVDTDHYVRFSFPSGSCTFSVHKSDSVTPGTSMLYFETADLDELYLKLKGAGIAFDDEPTDMPWNWREVHLTDPDGYRLCLYHAGEMRLDPPWKAEAD